MVINYFYQPVFVYLLSIDYGYSLNQGIISYSKPHEAFS